jgi:predicted SprT family Zn-dependent metalloprotease
MFKIKELPYKNPKTIEEKIENFRVRQSDKMLHPYTCGNDSRHRPLDARKEDENIVYFCKDCNYIQRFL